MGRIRVDGNGDRFVEGRTYKIAGHTAQLIEIRSEAVGRFRFMDKSMKGEMMMLHLNSGLKPVYVKESKEEEIIVPNHEAISEMEYQKLEYGTSVAMDKRETRISMDELEQMWDMAVHMKDEHWKKEIETRMTYLADYIQRDPNSRRHFVWERKF